MNCLGLCIVTWESLGPSQLTLRCLDDGEAVVWTSAQPHESPTHACILESTLRIGRAQESGLVWRAGSCDAPECGPWPDLN